MSLAMCGRDEEARQRVEENLAAFPDHHLVPISSAQALAACGDLDRAKGLYSRALDVAQEGGDPDDVEDVRDWFERFFVEYAPDDPDRGTLEERCAAWQGRTDRIAAEAEPGSELAPEESLVKHPPVVVGTKVGRNEPCPCGSGQKFKRCCGRA
jgi:hypothetical protein